MLKPGSQNLRFALTQANAALELELVVGLRAGSGRR
jgi:hypothetical protein